MKKRGYIWRARRKELITPWVFFHMTKFMTPAERDRMMNAPDGAIIPVKDVPKMESFPRKRMKTL